MLNESAPAYSFYELPRLQAAVETALRTEELSAKAADVLGQFGTPRAQQTLVDFASEGSWPLASRLRALSAIASAIKRNSILLTQESILAQYRRYNSSGRLDRDTQQVLSTILDILEQPSDGTTRDSRDTTQQVDNANLASP